MSIDLKAYLEKLKDQSTRVTEFPTDYQDTYDLGIKHGGIRLAKELWRLLCFDVDFSPEVPCHVPLSEERGEPRATEEIYPSK